MKKLLLLFILFIFCYSEESGRLMENVTVDYAGNPTTNQCEKNFEKLDVDFIEYDFTNAFSESAVKEKNIIFPDRLDKESVCSAVITGNLMSIVTPNIVSYSKGVIVSVDQAVILDSKSKKSGTTEYEFFSKEYGTEKEYLKALEEVKKMKNVYILKNACILKEKCEYRLLQYYKW